jgi:predicted extracellular nuclease
MHRWIILFTCLSLAWPQERLRVASWNLHNYFDSSDDEYSDPVPSAKKVETKTRQLSLALDQLKADVVAVQELEKRELLEELARRTHYTYAIACETNDPRGIRVGLLSRRKVLGYRSHRRDLLPYVEGNPTDREFSRDCLEVHLEGLIVLVNHFRSQVKANRRATSKRRAEAAAVRDLLTRLRRQYPDKQILVAGDFNDEMDSWALEPLANCGLSDAHISLPRGLRFTYVHRDQLCVLDYLLTTARVLEAGVGRERFFRSASDHYPVWADLAL